MSPVGPVWRTQFFEKSMSECLLLGPGDGIVSSLERGKRQGAVARPHEDCRGS